jgi:RHS repeat-associated protein
VYLYRGEQYDPDLGLYYLRARYYNPVTGRFLSRDPGAGRIKVPATLHKYLYASSDPIGVIDPTGRDLIEYVLAVARNPFFQATVASEIALCLIQRESQTPVQNPGLWYAWCEAVEWLGVAATFAAL